MQLHWPGNSDRSVLSFGTVLDSRSTHSDSIPVRLLSTMRCSENLVTFVLVVYFYYILLMAVTLEHTEVRGQSVGRLRQAELCVA